MTREGIKMTNDEAKSVLFDMLGKGIYVKDTKENQAILVALRALEQEPCEDWYDVPSDEMTLGQARQAVKDLRKMWAEHLWQEPCKMTVEEYRQRMIQAFHNADTDELIAVCVLPTEKEFEHLEWLLKNHYKKEPVLDKIIAEVKSIEINRDDYSQRQNDYCDGCAFTIKQVLQILDKYKAERGDKE